MITTAEMAWSRLSSSVVFTGGPLSEEDVEWLEALFGLRVFVRSLDRKIPDWPGLGGESQLRDVMAKAEAAVIDENSLPSSGPIPRDAIDKAGLRITTSGYCHHPGPDQRCRWVSRCFTLCLRQMRHLPRWGAVFRLDAGQCAD